MISKLLVSIHGYVYLVNPADYDLSFPKHRPERSQEAALRAMMTFSPCRAIILSKCGGNLIEA